MRQNRQLTAEEQQRHAAVDPAMFLSIDTLRNLEVASVARRSEEPLKRVPDPTMISDLNLRCPNARVWVNECFGRTDVKVNLTHALQNATHIAVVAHQDDGEIALPDAFAYSAGNQDLRHVVIIVVTDGAGSPRGDSPYRSFSPKEMSLHRQWEQEEAAKDGDYGAVVQLCSPSAALKDLRKGDPVIYDLRALLSEVNLNSTLVTHSPIDDHESHLGVSLRVIETLRTMCPNGVPSTLKFRGIEVWGDEARLRKSLLEFVPLTEQMVARQLELLDYHRSQIDGVKNYLRATFGRESMRATYRESHGTDTEPFSILRVNLDCLVSNTGCTSFNEIGDWVDQELKEYDKTSVARISKIYANQSDFDDIEV